MPRAKPPSEKRQPVAGIILRKDGGSEALGDARTPVNHAWPQGEGLLRAVYNDAPYAILLTGPGGLVRDANAQAPRLFGMTGDELRAAGLSGLTDPGDPDLPAFLDAQKDGRATRMEVRFRRKDGDTFNAEVSLTPYSSPEGPRTAVFIRDVEKQDALQMELSAFGKIQDFSALHLPDGDLRPMLEAVLDTAIEITHADMGNIQFLDPETHTLRIAAHRGFGQEFLDYWNNVTEGSGTCGTALKRGGHVLVEDVARSPIFAGTPALDVQLAAGVRAVQSIPLISRSGRRVGMLSTHYRAPRRFDQRFSRMVSLLAVLVADIIELANGMEELRRSKSEAEAATRAKSEFLANMSHEVRTPLNGVFGMVQLLQTTPLDGQQAAYVQMALESARRLLRLLSDILDLSRIEAGKLTLAEEAFDLSATIASVRSLFINDCLGKGLALETEITPGTPDALLGDETRLRQILINLVGNAVKFTAEGEVRIRVHTLARPGKDALTLIVEVSDTGVGIAEADMPLLFQAFSQVDSGLSRRFGGAGLGLGIVERIVGLHGGSLAVESAPGKGTTFTVALPLRLAAKPGEVPAGWRGAATIDRQAARAILLAEDEPVNLLAVKTMLQHLGYRVRAVTNGKLALEALETGDYDLVITDIQMPVVNGLGAIRAIRSSNRPFASIPVIAMTAHAMKGDKEMCLDAGMDGYISKPIMMAELREVVERALRSRAAIPPAAS